ncbi:hypothetical protein CDD81_5423 [Ophiocordyceps australis]|uniref:DUF159 domain protein n=1 Tax=Ophiocordyceps australis TaxID=1399860 RepID=A0A2C5Y837_9HYPO|nr:hypothetical protein CDD81_5423 [Ophiocordyceps australis]
MCGRYALALPPSQVRHALADYDLPINDAPPDHGPDAPRLAFNFAPGYHGLVYRANVADCGAGPAPTRQDDNQDTSDSCCADATYKLQAMKWGLIPFWTKRNPDYASLLRTINCRDDSLASPGGMWSAIKARKRCIVVAQGFYEWLRLGPREKVPHYVKRRDGRLLCLAGLWDCVQYQDSSHKIYSYTIITTSSNKQLSFLHDRMPVILDASAIHTWLDPALHTWSSQLQSLLRPYPHPNALDVYPVSKDVGKVGNQSPSFIVPVNSKENKANIANFFEKARNNDKHEEKHTKIKGTRHSEPSLGVPEGSNTTHNVKSNSKDTEIHEEKDIKNKQESESSLPAPQSKNLHSSSKRKTPPATPKSSPFKKISATHSQHPSPAKTKAKGSQKITNFFNHKS